MKLRYMIDFIKQADDQYVPVGVWVQGMGAGLDFEQFYGDSKVAIERESEAVWVINRLVEQGINYLPADFLEYHRNQRNPYEGNFSEIKETDEYASINHAGNQILIEKTTTQ